MKIFCYATNERYPRALVQTRMSMVYAAQWTHNMTADMLPHKLAGLSDGNSKYTFIEALRFG